MVREAGQVNRSVVDTSEPHSSDEAQREVERTRSQMSDTLGALEQKIEPRRLVDQVINAIKSSGVQSQVVDIVRNNPLPVMLLGAGAGWLAINLARGRQGPGQERPDAGQSTLGGIGQKVSDVYQAGKEKVSSVAGNISESISGTARSVGDKASEVIGSARNRVSDLAGSVSESVSGMTEEVRSTGEQIRPRQQFWDIFEEHPLAIAAGFVAAGVLAGLALPVSRREEEMLGDSAERLVDKARDSGRRAVQQTTDALTEKVSNVARSAADAATERMHSDEPLLDKVKGMAQDAADTIKEQMRKEGFMTEEAQKEPSDQPQWENKGARPQDTLEPPVEGGDANIPQASAFVDRPSDAMVDTGTAPEQLRDQIEDFTADRPLDKSDPLEDKDKKK